MNRQKSTVHGLRFLGRAMAALLFALIATMSWATPSIQNASAAVEAAEEGAWDSFHSFTAAAIESGDLAAVQGVVEEALSRHTVEGITGQTRLIFVNLQVFNGRISLLSGEYQTAREAFEVALQETPVGLIGGPWMDIHYGLSLSYWKTGFHEPFEESSDFYVNGDRFPLSEAMHYFNLFFVEEQNREAYAEKVRRYRNRGYADAELDLIERYAAWITEAFPAGT